MYKRLLNKCLVVNIRIGQTKKITLSSIFSGIFGPRTAKIHQFLQRFCAVVMVNYTATAGSMLQVPVAQHQHFASAVTVAPIASARYSVEFLFGLSPSKPDQHRGDSSTNSGRTNIKTSDFVGPDQ